MACSTAWHFCWGFQCFAQWLFDWQTIIAGLLALVAAGIAVLIARGQLNAAREQIDLARQQSADTRERRLRAARSSLSVTLSGILNYAGSAAEFLKGYWPAETVLYPDDVIPADIPFTIPDRNMPEFPSELITSLERVLELTSADTIAERIESVLREVQVLDARMRKMLQEGEVSRMMLAGMLGEAAAVYARAESLFAYARRRSETVDHNDLWERTFAAFSFLGVHEDDVLDAARRERDAGEPPGEAETPHPV